MALDFGFTVEHCDTADDNDGLVYSTTPVFGKVEYCRCSNELKANLICEALELFARQNDFEGGH